MDRSEESEFPQQFRSPGKLPISHIRDITSQPSLYRNFREYEFLRSYRSHPFPREFLNPWVKRICHEPLKMPSTPSSCPHTIASGEREGRWPEPNVSRVRLRLLTTLLFQEHVTPCRRRGDPNGIENGEPRTRLISRGRALPHFRAAGSRGKHAIAYTHNDTHKICKVARVHARACARAQGRCGAAVRLVR